MSWEVARIIKVQRNITSLTSGMSEEFTIVRVSDTKPVGSVRVFIRRHRLTFSRCVLISDRRLLVHFAGKPNATVRRRSTLNSRCRSSSHKGYGRQKKRWRFLNSLETCSTSSCFVPPLAVCLRQQKIRNHGDNRVPSGNGPIISGVSLETYLRAEAEIATEQEAALRFVSSFCFNIQLARPTFCRKHHSPVWSASTNVRFIIVSFMYDGISRMGTGISRRAPS